MSKKIKFSEESKGRQDAIKGIMPSPEELAWKEETVKVTLSLTKNSVDFFKKKAKTHRTQYQKMIRRLLDEYASTQI